MEIPEVFWLVSERSPAAQGAARLDGMSMVVVHRFQSAALPRKVQHISSETKPGIIGFQSAALPRRVQHGQSGRAEGIAVVSERSPAAQGAAPKKIDTIPDTLRFQSAALPRRVQHFYQSMPLTKLVSERSPAAQGAAHYTAVCNSSVIRVSERSPAAQGAARGTVTGTGSILVSERSPAAQGAAHDDSHKQEISLKFQSAALPRRVQHLTWWDIEAANTFQSAALPRRVQHRPFGKHCQYTTIHACFHASRNLVGIFTNFTRSSRIFVIKNTFISVR